MRGAKIDYDVIIVGGGPVGLSLAATFGRFLPELKVAVCDLRPFTVPKDPRASALSAGVTRLFETIGVWNDMVDTATPIEHMHITDSGTGDISRPLFLRFEGDVAPGRPFAHMVPNTTTIGALMQAVEGKADLLAPVELTRLRQAAGRAELDLADGKTLSASLIVAADGARSRLRQWAGIKTIGHAYGQSGIVTTIAHEKPHQNVAFEHFRPAGPFASLPLAGNRSSLVWTEQSEAAVTLVEKPAEELAEIIESVMGSSLGAVEIVDKVQAFPLHLQIARDFIGPRLALIGDAAHVVHPIAGQGLNLGLGDVAALSEVAADAFRLGQDIGAENVLTGYQRWRRFDTALMVVATDGLNRLFSNDIAPVRALRDIGLGLVDRAGPIKSALIRHAAAVGDGPRLMRGQPL